MPKVQLGVRVDGELLERVDEVRGDVPRARFVERALEEAVRGSVSYGSAGRSHPGPSPRASLSRRVSKPLVPSPRGGS